MNGKAINAIRTFPGEGIKVWGARTLDGNSQDWRYINVRRTMLFIEESVKNAAKAYVFEPNVFSKKGIRNSQSNMQTFSISPQDRTKILSLQIRRDGTCVKKYFSLLAQSYTWASTSIQGFG